MSSYRETQIIDAISKSPIFLGKLNEALSILYSFGVLEFLKERGRVKVFGPTDAGKLEIEAARSFGYNEAIDDLQFFKEKILDIMVAPYTPPMDYSALDQAVKENNLTQEEADAIRSGQNPKYSTSSKFPHAPGQKSS